MGPKYTEKHVELPISIPDRAGWGTLWRHAWEAQDAKKTASFLAAPLSVAFINRQGHLGTTYFRGNETCERTGRSILNETHSIECDLSWDGRSSGGRSHAICPFVC